jgi:hypothetical protein
LGEEIRGPWKLELEPMFGSSWRMELDELADLSTLDQSRHFAGTVTYKKTLSSSSKRPLQLDLGDVQGISELSLNGVQLGERWYGAHQYEFGDAWKAGENELCIRVTTTCGNYMKGLKDNQVAQRWVGHQKYYPMGLMGPVKLGPV